MGGGGGSTQQTTTESNQTTNQTTNQSGTQTNRVDPFTANARQGLINAAANVFARPYSWYPGELTAPFNNQRAGANVIATALATDPTAYSSIPLADMSYRKAMSPEVLGAQGANLQALQFLSNPQILDPRTNPWLAGTGDAMTRNINRILRTQTLPEIGSGAVATGQYGSSRQGISEGLAMTGAAQAVADANQQLYSGAYGQGLDAMTKGLALAPSTYAGLSTPEATAQQLRGTAMNQAYANAGALDSAGATVQQHIQGMVDRLVQAYNFNNQIPINSVLGLGSIINSTPPISTTATSSGTSTTTGTTTGTTTSLGPAGASVSPFQGAVAGAAAGAALTPATPWLGGSIGAIAGLIFN